MSTLLHKWSILGGGPGSRARPGTWSRALGWGLGELTVFAWRRFWARFVVSALWAGTWAASGLLAGRFVFRAASGLTLCSDFGSALWPRLARVGARAGLLAFRRTVWFAVAWARLLRGFRVARLSLRFGACLPSWPGGRPALTARPRTGKEGGVMIYKITSADK